MSILAIILALGLLMFLAYRGYSVIVFAPVMALGAAALSGLNFLPVYSEVFMVKLATYVKNFFPLFLLGAVFGKLMEESGSATAIAHWLVKKIGSQRAILAVVLAAAILTYGGVSLFVVVFSVYPVAAALFREANIPKRLIPGAIALGSFTFTMVAIPGTPQIQNLIPAKYFGTDAYAAPIIGSVAAVVIFLIGTFWLEYQRKKALAAGEGYGSGHINEPKAVDLSGAPNPIVALIPLVVVIVLNYIFTGVIKQWPDSVVAQFTKDAKMASNVGSYALILALVLGIISIIIFNYNRIKGNLSEAFTQGGMGSLLPIMNTATEVGFGGVISALPGFKLVAAALLGLKASPIITEAISVNILAGITGSASGGMSIALEMFAKNFLDLAAQHNISPEVLHRIASLACSGLDTLPHNGAVITLLAITGLTHRQSYKDIFVVSVLAPLAGTIVAIILALMGIK